MRVAHFILYVNDQAAASAFFRAVLDREPRLDVPGMTEFDVGEGAVLGLMPRAGIERLLGIEASAEGPPRAEIYLLVDDPAAFHARSLAGGATELSSLDARDWGHEAAYSLDPFGTVLAFARPGGEG